MIISFMKLNKFCLLFFLILFTGIILPQSSPDKVVDMKVKSPKVISLNKLTEAEIILQIKNGWHINSNKPLDENLSPTVISIKDNPNIQIKKIIYPEPVITKLQFSQSQMALYEGEAIVKIQFLVKKDFKKSILKLEGEVQYQPCNNQTCLFPTAKNFSTNLKIKK